MAVLLKRDEIKQKEALKYEATGKQDRAGQGPEERQREWDQDGQLVYCALYLSFYRQI